MLGGRVALAALCVPATLRRARFVVAYFSGHGASANLSAVGGVHPVEVEIFWPRTCRRRSRAG
eukprot:8783930-Prorocentrum_lima.AAC.1